MGRYTRCADEYNDCNSHGYGLSFAVGSRAHGLSLSAALLVYHLPLDYTPVDKHTCPYYTTRKRTQEASMKRGRPKQTANPLQETPGFATETSTTEEPLLRIDELEPRLTPDGYNPYNSNPPHRQVGWGC
jgi:hypothetical protein